MVRKNSCPRLIFCLVLSLFFENTALGFGGGVATGVIQGKDPLQSGLAGGIGAGLSEMVAEKVGNPRLEKFRKEAKENGLSKKDIESGEQAIKETAGKWGKIIAITAAFTGGLDPEVALQAANTSIDNNWKSRHSDFVDDTPGGSEFLAAQIH